MNELINPTAQPLTMSSREIAELCGKQHAHVMRDIRTMLDGLGGQSNFGSTYLDVQGKERECFNLPKRETLILVSGYNVELRAKIIDRWMELESQQAAPVALPDLSDPVVLVQLLTEHAGKRIEAEKRAAIAEEAVESAKPKTAFYDQFVNADGLYGLQNAARVLNEPPNKFIGWLKQNYLFYQGGCLVPRVQYRQQGIFEVKVTMVDDKARSRTFVTPKGIRYLGDKLRKPPGLFDSIAS